MSTTTTNYNIVLPEGTDTFNPLVYENDAFTLIDAALKAVDDFAITTATHVLSGSINTLTRSKANRNMIVFIATSDYLASQAFTVDGNTVVFRDADATTPRDGAFKTNQAVVCYLNGSILEMVSTGGLSAAIGSTDISTIGDGTCTGAISVLFTDLRDRTVARTSGSTSGMTYTNQIAELYTQFNAININKQRTSFIIDSDGRYYTMSAYSPTNIEYVSNRLTSTSLVHDCINLYDKTYTRAIQTSTGITFTDSSTSTYSGNFYLYYLNVPYNA